MLGSLRMLKDLRMSMSKPICWCHPPVQGIFPSLQKLVLSLVPLASLSHSLESVGFNFQWVGLRDELQESPIFQWENRWFPVLVDFPLSQWHTHIYIYICMIIYACIFSRVLRGWKKCWILCAISFQAWLRLVHISVPIACWRQRRPSPFHQSFRYFPCRVERTRFGSYHCLLVLSREWMGMGEWDDYY